MTVFTANGNGEFEGNEFGDGGRTNISISPAAEASQNVIRGTYQSHYRRSAYPEASLFSGLACARLISAVLLII